MTGIFIILSMAVLAWVAVLAYRTSALAGCAVFLVATCCLSNEFWTVDAAGLSWSIDRFLLFGLVGLFAAQTAIRRTDQKRFACGEVLLETFLLLLIISTFTHDWKSLGPDEVPVLMHLVNGYLIPATIFWIARNSILDGRSVRTVQAILACFGIYLAVTALFEIAGLWTLVFPKYIADPSVGIHFGRARGPFVQSARLGTYLIACCAATGLLAWQRIGGKGGRFAFVASIPLYAAAIFATYTRSVWMGAGLALAVALGMTLRGRFRSVALGGMAAAALLVLTLKGSDLVSLQRETSGSVTRESTYMRASFAYISWQMFKDRPLAGVGFGQFARNSPFYLSDRDTDLHLEAIRGYIHHNTLLSILVEVGLVGLILFVLILFDWIRSGWLLWRDRDAARWIRGHALFMLLCFAPYFCQLMFREVSYSPQENSLIFLLAGVTSGLRAMRRHAPATSAARSTADSTGLPCSVAPARPLGSL